MREIKFRAKCKLLGRWMYGSLYIKKNGKVYINSTEVHPETVGQFTGIDAHKGRRGKNGQHVFEGDILELTDVSQFSGDEDTWPTDAPEYDARACVKFENGSYHLWEHIEDVLDDCGMESGYVGELFTLSEMVHIKIIGNVHDNPELLK